MRTWRTGTCHVVAQTGQQECEYKHYIYTYINICAHICMQLIRELMCESNGLNLGTVPKWTTVESRVSPNRSPFSILKPNVRSFKERFFFLSHSLFPFDSVRFPMEGTMTTLFFYLQTQAAITQIFRFTVTLVHRRRWSRRTNLARFLFTFLTFLSGCTRCPGVVTALHGALVALLVVIDEHRVSAANAHSGRTFFTTFIGIRCPIFCPRFGPRRMRICE